MNVSLPPLEKPFMSTFLLSYFPPFVARKVAVFVSKTYAFRLQDLCFSPARPMVLGSKSAFRRGQELWSWGLKAASGGGKSRGGKGLPCCLLQLGLTKIFQPVWLT